MKTIIKTIFVLAAMSCSYLSATTLSELQEIPIAFSRTLEGKLQGRLLLEEETKALDLETTTSISARNVSSDTRITGLTPGGNEVIIFI